MLPLIARDAALILSPANTAPLASRRNVVFVHDLAPLREPAWFGRAYGAWHRIATTPNRGAGAAAAGAVASSSRASSTNCSGSNRIACAWCPLAVAAGLSPDAGPRPTALDAPYVLALGTPSARKNLELLDRVAPGLREAGLEVVVAGAGRSYLQESAAGARRLGYVEERDLPALYAHAEVLAMPSLYEGFGLPCIEAMACGTPVVAADRAALPEACGGAALLVDPDDADAFAAALIRAAGPERERLVEAGRARAAGLSWARSAESVDAAIGALL